MKSWLDKVQKAFRGDRKSGFEEEDQKTWDKLCRHPEHNPPTHLYIPAGKRYRHVCPGCGFEIVMRSSEAMFQG